MFIDLPVCSRAMLCKHRFHVDAIRSQGSKASKLFLCSLNQLTFLGIAHRPMSLSMLKRIGTDEHQAMLVCKQMRTEWSNETLMVRLVEHDGAHTLGLVTGDANTQMNDFDNFRIYFLEFKLPALALKNRGHVQHSYHMQAMKGMHYAPGVTQQIVVAFRGGGRLLLDMEKKPLNHSAFTAVHGSSDYVFGCAMVYYQRTPFRRRCGDKCVYREVCVCVVAHYWC